MLPALFLSEVVGTAMLLLLGCWCRGQQPRSTKSKGQRHRVHFLHMNWGWGLAVFAGVLVSLEVRCAHLNPAVTFGVVASPRQGASSARQVPVDCSDRRHLHRRRSSSVLSLVPCVCWLAYKQHFDEDAPDPATKLGVFSTCPEPSATTAGTVVTEAHRHLRAGPVTIIAAGSHSSPTVSSAGSSALGGRSADRRYRCLPRWSHRVRHQPRS